MSSLRIDSHIRTIGQLGSVIAQRIHHGALLDVSITQAAEIIDDLQPDIGYEDFPNVSVDLDTQTDIPWELIDDAHRVDNREDKGSILNLVITSKLIELRREQPLVIRTKEDLRELNNIGSYIAHKAAYLESLVKEEGGLDPVFGRMPRDMATLKLAIQKLEMLLSGEEIINNSSSDSKVIAGYCGELVLPRDIPGILDLFEDFNDPIALDCDVLPHYYTEVLIDDYDSIKKHFSLSDDDMKKLSQYFRLRDLLMEDANCTVARDNFDIFIDDLQRLADDRAEIMINAGLVSPRFSLNDLMTQVYDQEITHIGMILNDDGEVLIDTYRKFEKRAF